MIKQFKILSTFYIGCVLVKTELETNCSFRMKNLTEIVIFASAAIAYKYSTTLKTEIATIIECNQLNPSQISAFES